MRRQTLEELRARARTPKDAEVLHLGHLRWNHATEVVVLDL